MTGHDPTHGSGKGVLLSHGSGRVGSGRVESGRVKSGRVMSFSTGRVRSPLPDPNRPGPRCLTRPVHSTGCRVGSSLPDPTRPNPRTVVNLCVCWWTVNVGRLRQLERASYFVSVPSMLEARIHNLHTAREQKNNRKNERKGSSGQELTKREALAFLFLRLQVMCTLGRASTSPP